MSAPRLLCPDKRTFASTSYTSALGHERTHAVQQNSEPFYHRNTLKQGTNPVFGCDILAPKSQPA